MHLLYWLDSRRSINFLTPPLRLQGIVVFHNQFKTLNCAWMPVMSVHLRLSISLSISLYPSVSICPSVICPSLCPHVLRVLSRALVDPVVNGNFSYYNFLPLLSYSSLVWRTKGLLCACVTVSECLCIDAPTARLVKRLGAVDTNKAVLFVWSQVTVLRPAAQPTATCQLNYNWQVSTD